LSQRLSVLATLYRRCRWVFLEVTLGERTETHELGIMRCESCEKGETSRRMLRHYGRRSRIVVNLRVIACPEAHDWFSNREDGHNAPQYEDVRV
jgi:hypothetical protein